jgi:hypothetical protein
MRQSELTDLGNTARLYARSKGLTLLAQGVVFAAGVVPLLRLACADVRPPMPAAIGLYFIGVAFFILAVWIALRFVPEAIDSIYYSRVGNARASSPETPGWARLLAPACIILPIGAAGIGLCDAWQATVTALTIFGVHLYVIGRHVLREPGTEVIGGIAVLLGGLVAAEPALAIGPTVVSQEIVTAALMQAQAAALGTTAWLGVAWIVSSIVLHAYNRWLLAEIARTAKGPLQ